MMEVFSIVKEKNAHPLYEVQRLDLLQDLPDCPFCHVSVNSSQNEQQKAAAASADTATSFSRAELEMFDKLRQANKLAFLQDVNFEQLRSVYVPQKAGKAPLSARAGATEAGDDQDQGGGDLAEVVKGSLFGDAPCVQLLLGSSGRSQILSL